MLSWSSSNDFFIITLKIRRLIHKNNLVKVTSANIILVICRMVAALLTQKVLSVLVGAQGIALVGNLKNVIRFLEHFSILGTSEGLVKYIAEYKKSEKSVRDIFSIILVFTIITSICVFVICFFFSKDLSIILFKDTTYSYIFKVLSFIIPFIGLGAFLNAFLNGLSAYKQYTKSAITTVILAAILIVLLTYYLELKGALLAICFIPIIQCFSCIAFLSKSQKGLLKTHLFSLDIKLRNYLLSYGVTSIIVIASVNICDIAIRSLITHYINLDNAGYWTAMSTISKTYMQFLSALFPLYILPRYATISNKLGFITEIKKIYTTLIPVIILGMFFVYLFRLPIIKLLYTDDFLIATTFFKWQLLGDFIKFIALVMAYVFLAKKQLYYFFITEIISVILFYSLSVFFIKTYHTEGVIIAHFIRNIGYLFMVLILLKRYFVNNGIESYDSDL